ncbi:unnamed protein product [Parascedosporium putredinis]|uniref:Uncharacterized protein n=1 Tax=Parascedosporium putredinis TaxID=1442378 RepID=A0A9P1MAA4_9PEZI|nr:unnamed protein product [Parascedosporium putredinis]CAI7993570.1 unnamed protein product [Parascedosporium putredinis]
MADGDTGESVIFHQERRAWNLDARHHTHREPTAWEMTSKQGSAPHIPTTKNLMQSDIEVGCTPWSSKLSIMCMLSGAISLRSLGTRSRDPSCQGCKPSGSFTQNTSEAAEFGEEDPKAAWLRPLACHPIREDGCDASTSPDSVDIRVLAEMMAKFTMLPSTCGLVLAFLASQATALAVRVQPRQSDPFCDALWSDIQSLFPGHGCTRGTDDCFFCCPPSPTTTDELWDTMTAESEGEAPCHAHADDSQCPGSSTGAKQSFHCDEDEDHLRFLAKLARRN